MTDQTQEKKRTRRFLNPSIRGKNTDIILESIAPGMEHLINNVEAVNDSIYIVSAEGQYLEQLLAGRGITKPENVGLSDDIFREIGIEVSNRKQVRDLIMNILNIIYGDEFTKSTSSSDELETYNLEDGDTLIIQFDDEESLEVVFNTDQFSNINSSTAQEVADAITKEIRRLGRKGSAIQKDDGSGGYVTLISGTNGPASTVRVLGGKAQNKLKFAQIRPTTALAATQWDLSLQSGGVVRATWSGGPNPSVGKVRTGDYVNLYGTAFDINNRGTFTVTAVNGGLVGDAYVEFLNETGIVETVVQGTDEAILFFFPERKILTSKLMYAAAYQTESRLLEIFIPATTKVVRRERKGGAYLHDFGVASTVDDLGTYVWDISKPYAIGSEECNTNQVVDSNTGLIIQVDDSSNFPDETGHLVFSFGTSKEEGPVEYISRPSNNTLMINPSYRFKNVHDTGTNISLITKNFTYDVAVDGSDYPFYLTDIVSGRIYAEDLIKLVAATGIRLVINVLYPGSIGLGKWGTEFDEKVVVWGPDAS
jgi:hypothetical protein